MEFEPGKGALFRNGNRRGDQDPTHKGECCGPDGQMYRISA
jgi:hypothetical protein